METENLMVVPRGNPKDGRQPIKLNFGELHQLEYRQEEVARVNRSTAPELCKTFSYAWRELAKYAAWVEAELNAAKQYVNITKATIVLDKAPGLLSKRGLRSTAENVQAICDIDPDYQQAIDRRDQISAYLELLKVKSKAFEMAYQSAKKAMGESTGRPEYIGRELNGMLSEDAIAGNTVNRDGKVVDAEVTEVKNYPPGMGPARY